MYYLDNAATTAPHPRVLEEINRLYASCFGNPSSVHPAGQDAMKVLNQSRKTLSAIFRVPLAGIIFCGSGTESDNLAIKGVVGQSKNPSPQIIVSPLEHAAIAKTCEWLEKQRIATVKQVRVHQKTGQVDLDHLFDLVNADTSLVSIQHVNSEVGTIQDLGAISNVIKNKNPRTLLHSDGVQAFGRIPVNLAAAGVDLYSISAHKFHGVKGAGALVLTRELALEPLMHGGGQEHGLRSGTENIVGIAAMALAADIAVSELEENNQKMTLFAKQFKDAINDSIPDCCISEPPERIPHIVSIRFPGLLGEVLLHHLAERKIYVSTGSACNATSKKLSPVLQALGFSKENIMETIRISMAPSEIPTDRETFFKRFNDTVLELRKKLT